ncbi:hypothetical protein F-VV10_0371 [Faustovirus]|nr:hypothetical protein F-VV10_0371 [Faustovirus]
MQQTLPNGRVYEHALLKRQPSSIQGAGYGVFAVAPIPADTVLFTYAAEISNYALTLAQDRCYTFDVVDDTTGRKNTYCAGMWDLGGYINDIVDFRPLTAAESIALFNLKPPLTANTYNCRFEHDATTKQVRIVAINDIAPGQELFISYGANYWIPRYITGRKITGVAKATPVVKN